MYMCIKVHTHVHRGTSTQLHGVNHTCVLRYIIKFNYNYTIKHVHMCIMVNIHVHKSTHTYMYTAWLGHKGQRGNM